MTNHDVIQKLKELKYRKLAESFVKVVTAPSSQNKSINELLLMMLSYEDDILKTSKIEALLKQANLLVPSSLDDIEYDSSGNLSKNSVMQLRNLEFMKSAYNIVITSSTGSGKSYLGTAFGFEACRSIYNVIYYRLPTLLQEISIKRDKGAYKQFMRKLKKSDLLIIDDLGLSNLSIQESRELLEVLEDRNKIKSTILISQLPFEKWYETFKDPTLADAIIDRIAYNSYKFELKGESMRKRKAIIH